MCLFCASLYVNLTLRRNQDIHSKVSWMSTPKDVFLTHP